MPDGFARWLEALEARHLADFRLAEVARALRALSSAYVERRHRLQAGGALETAGKRAAFALFYGPVHFLTISQVIAAIGDPRPQPTNIVDLGCGTGVGGAAWALHGGATPRVFGIDRHPWAVDESRWTYRTLGVNGQARTGDLRRIPRLSPGGAVIATYTLNELDDTRRAAVETQLLAAARGGTRVLIVEPIARSIAPWWDETAAAVRALGGREDEWRFRVELPSLLRTLDKAAGLRHDELTARTLYL
jgi:hypothetical protein